MKFVDKILLEGRILLQEKNTNYTYGCAMLKVKVPEIKNIHSIIKPEDLYIGEGNDQYGMEKETHITLLYGLHDQVTPNEIQTIINEFKFPSSLLIKNISIFDNPEYDVLKLDIEKIFLSKVHKKLSELPNSEKYPEYHPHLTIAYLKKGKAQKYIGMFEDEVHDFDLSVLNGIYSENTGKKSLIKLNFSSI